MSEWISIGARVPGIEVAVLTTYRGIIEIQKRHFGKGDHTYWTLCTPTHWMPLPSLPSEESAPECDHTEMVSQCAIGFNRVCRVCKVELSVEELTTDISPREYTG